MNKISFLLLLLPLGGTCLGAVVFDLNDVVLDGSAGENTYIARNSTSAGGLSYDGGTPSLTYNLNGTNSYSYFVSYFDAQTLAVGDSLELSYAFTPTSTNTFRNVNETFRVGLYDSKGTQVDSDTDGTGLAGYNDDRGYMGLYSPNATPSSTTDKFFQRTGSNNLLWSSGTRTVVSGSPTLESPGTGSVTGLFRITLQSATELLLESQINGNTFQSVLDTAGLETTFDSLSFFVISGADDQSLTFSDMTVTVIPEPSSLILVTVAGLFYLLVGFTRRRI
ncbi:MAG: PEP-CTERM sorting domain-containing protein [Kiritimatiellia bacterium]